MPWTKGNLPKNVQSIAKKEEWTEKQIEIFVKVANIVLEETGDEGEAVATAIIDARKNNTKPIEESQMNGLNLSKTTLTGIAKKLNAMVTISNFKEEDHPRDGGKFTSKEKDKKTTYSIKKTTDGKFDVVNPDGKVVKQFNEEKAAKKYIAEKITNSKEYTVKINAKQMPKTYMARHMKEGLARYEEEDGEDVILVRNEALRKMCDSMQGVPVYVHHQDVDMENLQQQADGYVSRCFYNENDGWWWAEFVAVSDEAHNAIEKGWQVSNAYGFEEIDVRNESGTYINVPYNREILNGEYNHLGIVPNPRYEDSVIMNPEEYKQYNSQLRDSLENVK